MHRPWRRLCSMPSSRRREWEVRSRRLPPIGAGDAHPLLVLSGTEPELGGGKKPIDDDVIATHAVVHEFGGIALRTKHEKRGKDRKSNRLNSSTYSAHRKPSHA